MKRTTWFILGGLLVAAAARRRGEQLRLRLARRARLGVHQGLHRRRGGRDHRRRLHGPATPRTTSWPTARSPTTASAASTTRSSPPGLPACSACCSPSPSAAGCSGSSAPARADPRRQPPPAQPPGARREPMGAGHAHALLPRPGQPGAPAPARGQDRRDGGVHRRGGGHAARGVLGVRRVRRPDRGRRPALARVPAALAAQPVADRAAVRGVRVGAAVPRQRRAGRPGWACSCPSTASTAAGTSWPRAPSACSPRCCWPRPPRPAT